MLLYICTIHLAMFWVYSCSTMPVQQICFLMVVILIDLQFLLLVVIQTHQLWVFHTSTRAGSRHFGGQKTMGSPLGKLGPLKRSPFLIFCLPRDLWEEHHPIWRMKFGHFVKFWMRNFYHLALFAIFFVDSYPVCPVTPCFPIIILPFGSLWVLNISVVATAALGSP